MASGFRVFTVFFGFGVVASGLHTCLSEIVFQHVCMVCGRRLHKGYVGWGSCSEKMNFVVNGLYEAFLGSPSPPIQHVSSRGGGAGAPLKYRGFAYHIPVSPLKPC